MLDRYSRTQAGQDARKDMAAPLVLVPRDGGVGGCDALSAPAVLPDDLTRRLPRYRLVPATSAPGQVERRTALRFSASRLLTMLPA